MKKLIFTFAAIATVALAAPATAEQISAPPKNVITKPLIEQAQWRGPGWRRGSRCSFVRRSCAANWGWGGPGWRRCVWRRGC
jgi:hypothetical protein